MTSRRVVTAMVLLGALAAPPAFARDGEGRRTDRRGVRADERSASREAPRVGRAVPRSANERRPDVQRQPPAPPQYQVQRQTRPFGTVQRQFDVRRDYDVRRNYVVRPGYGRPGYVNRGVFRGPRVIRPSIVTIVPYRPYVYRPSLSIGVFYGAGGSYPYGYTPRGYYDPIPGRAYGGVRITDAPRDAQVFADGYYVGIVNDFDGVFQHMNLEAGPHHIEIEADGFEPVAFDVVVQPGRTITFRAGMYPY